MRRLECEACGGRIRLGKNICEYCGSAYKAVADGGTLTVSKQPKSKKQAGKGRRWHPLGDELKDLERKLQYLERNRLAHPTPIIERKIDKTKELIGELKKKIDQGHKDERS